MSTVAKKGQLLSNMLLLATNAHAGQFDKGGNPYILHPLAVMSILNTTDEELNCIAIGHDVVEDCNVTYKQLKEAGFTNRIIEGIKALTKVPGETPEEYEQKVKANPDAIKVKLADLTHNTDIRRLKGTTAKDIARVEKYFKMFVSLSAANQQVNSCE